MGFNHRSSKTFIIALLPVLAGILCPHCVIADSASAAQEVPAISPDRPGFTNGCDTVLPKHWQIETGITSTQLSAENGGSKVVDYPEALIRLGVSSKFEYRIGAPNYNKVDAGGSGYSDMSLGCKYRFYESNDGNTKAALIPFVTIPNGSDAFSSHHVDPYLTLAGQKPINPKNALSANLTLGAPTVNGSRIYTIAPSVSVSTQLQPALSLYGELYDNVPQHGGSTPIIDGGFAYIVNPNMQLDIEVGYGLGSNAPVRTIGGGIAIRL